MGDAIQRFIRRSGIAGEMKYGRLADAWHQVLPRQFHGRARVGGYRNRVVTIEVSSSAVLQEMSQFWREGLRRALIEKLGGEYVRELRFVLRDTGKRYGKEKG